jgi:hypothetical protein
LAPKEVQDMARTMAARIRELREMSVGELAARYREVFGEETRSRNKDWLWKRIAWRIQALEEGDLSERARRRAADLARDADARIRPPEGAFEETESRKGTTRARAARLPHRDVRLPLPGTVLTREYKGRSLRVAVLDGTFDFEGRTYRSLSAIAREVTGSQWNGFLFFGLTERAGAGSER